MLSSGGICSSSRNTKKSFGNASLANSKDISRDGMTILKMDDKHKTLIKQNSILDEKLQTIVVATTLALSGQTYKEKKKDIPIHGIEL